MEEEKTLEEKAEVAEQVAEPVSEEEADPTPELPGAEVSSEVETTKVQELAEQVKACVVETRSCEDLGTKFDTVATELGIGVDDLINQVFEIIARKEG